MKRYIQFQEGNGNIYMIEQKKRGREYPDSHFDENELEKGIEVELEHTDDRGEAKKIAKDHLAEVDDYYTKLSKYVENEVESLRINKKIKI